MNARQKAKVLKKELDYIKNIPVRNVYRVIDIPSEHLKVACRMDLKHIESYGEEFIEAEVKRELSYNLMKEIKERIIVNRDNEHPYYRKYSTDIWVAFGRK